MAIQNLPAWIGSQAVAETGQRWMSQARPVVNLPAAGWMSEMAGRAKWNAVLIIGRKGSGSIWGYSSGFYGGLTNNTGQSISILASTNRSWDQGVDSGLYLGCFNAGFSRIDCTLEGFNGNEKIPLVNHGTNGLDGSRLYFQNWRLDIYNWMTAREGWHINVLLEFR